jgi:hypothetical protein
MTSQSLFASHKQQTVMASKHIRGKFMEFAEVVTIDVVVYSYNVTSYCVTLQLAGHVVCVMVS